MIEVTNLNDSARRFLSSVCDTCRNKDEGADKCRIKKDGKCNYEPEAVFNRPKCHECVFGMQRPSPETGGRTFDCSIGNFWGNCDKFIHKSSGVPAPVIENAVNSDAKPAHNPMTHCIKIRESFANAVHMGIKTFEIRKNDRGYQKGDHVKFTVLYDSDGLEMISHPLHDMTFEITYVLAGWGLQDGYVVFGIKPVMD